MKNKIGADLGTTFSEVGIVNDSGVVEIIPDLNGNLKIPSVVSYANGKPVVGRAALQDLIWAPQFVIRCGKRYMGKMTPDGKPIPLLSDPSGNQITAVDFSAAILRHIKDSAETFLGYKVESVVITVPAYFGITERQNTKAAAMIAGFTDVKLQDEPVAAAMYYGLEKGRDEVIVVVDYGGGTLDVTAIEVKGNTIKVITTTGDAEHGGSNYDECTLAYACEQVKSKGIQILPEKDLADFNKGLDQAREAKEMLSIRQDATVILESKGKRAAVKIDRDIFRETISKDLDRGFADCCRKLREQVMAKGIKVDRVLLVGGSSRMPQVTDMVKDVFGIEPSKDTDPDFVVAKGAAIDAAVNFGEEGQIIAVGKQRYLASEITLKTVAAHAICVAARRTGDMNDSEEYNCVIVPANTELPYEFEERFEPVDPRQTSVVAKIVQGEPGQPSKDAAVLRKITIPIKPSDKHADRIKLKGRYTEEGLLETVFIDELLGKPVSDSFVYSAGLDKAEISNKREQLSTEMER